MVAAWIAQWAAADAGLTLGSLLPIFAQSGALGVVLWVILHMHRDAVKSHDQRATDWRMAWQAESARADTLQQQLIHIVEAVKTAAGSKPES